MDLNMIKGLGPTFRQTLYKNGILDVEQLLRNLPSKIQFFEVSNLSSIKESSTVTLVVTVATYFDSSNEEETFNFSVNCEGKMINASIKNSYYNKKQLIPGKKIKIRGYFDIKNDCIEVETIFEVNSDFFETFYELGDLPSSQVHNFSEKGLAILSQFPNELPNYINEKIGVKNFMEILSDIHIPKSSDSFIKALENYTFEMFFKYFTCYYYYIVSTSLTRQEEISFDLSKITSAIADFESLFTSIHKANLNFILKEFKKPFYTNILIENSNDIDKEISTIISIVSKVSLKKQVVIITKENFDFYSNLKEKLVKRNIKVDIMARKGRNKENFESFNSGKYDVLITQPVNFETIDTKRIGLVINDFDDFFVNKRFSLNCNNTDTIFYSKSSLGKNLDASLFKNLNSFNNSEYTSSIKDVIFENLLHDKKFKILNELIDEQKFIEVIRFSSELAFDFVKNKKFKDNKENLDYFKKVIDSFSDGNSTKK